MTIFLYELKKIWSWRVLVIIAAFFVIVWFAILHWSVSNFEHRMHVQQYGALQIELFELFGDTLEPEEWEAFDIPARVAAVIAEVATYADPIIAANAEIFAEHGIYSYAQYRAEHHWQEHWTELLAAIRECDKAAEAYFAMQEAANLGWFRFPDGTYGSGEEGWFSTDDIPRTRYGALRDLEYRYVRSLEHIALLLEENWWRDSEISTFKRNALQQIYDKGNNSLIADAAARTFAEHSMLTAVFAVVAVMVLVLPSITVDRVRKVNHIQYAAAGGRRVFRIHFAAMLTSAVLLSGLIMLISYLPLMLATGQYWNASIMSFGGNDLWLHDISYGQYVLALAGVTIALCLAGTCFAFLAARLSSNIMPTAIRATPAAIGLVMLIFLAMPFALSDFNMVYRFLGSQHSAPEAAIPLVLAGLALIPAVVFVIRERKVEML